MRVLVAGHLSSPHVIGWTAMLVELDYDVVLVGHRPPGRFVVEPPEGLALCEELAYGWIPLVRTLELGRDLRQAVMQVRPAIVHAHWLPEYGWLAARAGLHPLVSSAWGSDVLAADWLGRRRSRAAIRGADLVLADSAALAAAASQLVPNGPPVELFHPGVDLDRFSPGDRAQARRALGWQTDVPVVLSPRGFEPIYNQGSVIKSFALLRRGMPDARLILKHQGDTVPAQISNIIRSLGLSEAIDIVGRLDGAAMCALYRAADVVVSVPSSDSSPATAWEALACSRPLIVSDLPWAREELRHRENAWISPIDDELLAEACGVLLTDRDLADRLGEHGSALVRQTRDRRRQMQALDRRYRSLVA